jgi:hypothetical protein
MPITRLFPWFPVVPLLSAIAPAVIAAQSTSVSQPTCSPHVLARNTARFGRATVIVDVTGIAAKDSEVAVVGARTTLFDPGLLQADSLLGVVWSAKDGATGIPIPPGHRPVDPKIAASKSGWDVVFFDAPDAGSGGLLTGATAWFGHFDGAWTSVTQIADLTSISAYTGFASELVSHDGTLGLLLNFEDKKNAPPGLDRGFQMMTRSRAGVWGVTDVAAPTGPGRVTLSPGLSDTAPFLLGVVQPRWEVPPFRRPSLAMRLGVNGSPVWFAEGPAIAADANAVLIGNRMVAAWSTYPDRHTISYASTDATGSAGAPVRQLSHPVREGPRLISSGFGAALFGLDLTAPTLRSWWLDGHNAAVLRDSIMFERTIFKYSIAKSASGLLYIVALQVPSMGMSGDPSMEIVSATMRCGTGETSKPFPTRRPNP